MMPPSSLSLATPRGGRPPTARQSRFRGGKLVWALSLPFALGLIQAAVAMDCPAPPVQSRKDWDTQVRAEVGRVGPVRGAELEARLRTVTQDLMGRLPGADKLYLEQMMFSAYCSALRDDAKIPGAEKSKLILEYRRALDAALKPPQQ